MRALFERMLIERTEQLALGILSTVFVLGLLIGGSLSWWAAWSLASFVPKQW